MRRILCVLALLVCLCNAASVSSKAPQSVPTYTVSGILTLPYAEINEAFQAWYDESQFASRIDYYAG